MIRDYATDDSTKDDGTLHLLTGTSFVNWDPDTDRYDINDLGEALKLAKGDLGRFPAITVPSSLWTAGCFVRGGYAVFGNDRVDPKETFTNQVSMDKLHMEIKGDIVSGKPTEVKLFPAFPGCMNDVNRVTLRP